MSKSLRRRATAVVIIDGKVLLVRDKGTNRFSLPGGGIKKGEPSTSAAARELYEELGLRATVIRRLRDCDFQGSVNAHCVCLIEAEGDVHFRGHELDEFIWWDMRKPISIHPHVLEILSRVSSYIRK